MSKLSDEDILQRQQEDIHDRLSRALHAADIQYGKPLNYPSTWFYLDRCLLPALKKFGLKVVLVEEEKKEKEKDL